MFNQMDTNGDGKISLNEMKAYAEKMNLDRGYVKDFSEYVHIKAGEPENHDHPAVDFDHFLAALQQRDATVMRACAMGGYGGRSIFDEVAERSVWLLGLLVLQSLSGVVLQRYEQLLAEHVVIAVFLTMLVGAGGNAGNQSAIKIIEKIVLGEITVSIGSFLSEMHREVIVGMFLCVFVAIGGFVRAYITHGRARGGFLNVLALTCCLAVIVFSSTLIGVMLPFFLAKIGADPAHAGTVVQVVMDITGVIVTVTICSMMLPSVSKKTRTPAFAAFLERAFLAYFPESESGGAPKEHRSDADLVLTSEKGSV
jgi:cation transporter-like permease